MDNSASLRNKPQFSIPEGVLRAVDAVRSVASPVINQAKEFGQGYMATTDEAFKRMDEQTRAGKDPLNSTFQLGNAITNAPGIGAGDDILKFLPAVIGSVRAVSKTGKIAHEASKADDLAHVVKSLGSKVDPLIDEARKYKSVEEFIKAQGDSVFHGTKNNFDTFKLSSSKGQYGENQIPGVYFTPSKDIATMFAKDPVYGMAKGSVKDAIVKFDKPLVAESPNELAKKFGFKDYVSADKKKIGELAKSQGFDGIVIKKMTNGQDEIIALDTGKIHTKQSLTDIWNKSKNSNIDQDLLNTLTPRQKEAFAKGTPQEKKIALDYLRQKNNIETNLAKFQQEVDQGKNIMGHSDIIDDVVNRFDNNYSSLKPNNTIDMELEDDARRLYKDLLGKEKNDAPLSTIVGELNEALDFYRNKQK